MFRFLNFTKRKWLIHWLHTGLQCLICWLTAANPPPICFGIPHVKAAKACVKLAKISIKKGHTGACAALEFKTFHATKGIPLGCFFFRGDDGLDIGTFLDSESLMLLLGHLLQDAVVCFSCYDSFELFLTRKTKESQILSSNFDIMGIHLFQQIWSLFQLSTPKWNKFLYLKGICLLKVLYFSSAYFFRQCPGGWAWRREWKDNEGEGPVRDCIGVYGFKQLYSVW